MKKKGFTLIELLAVIVVLAIIALIATPIVMNVIKDSKKGATERSAERYLDAVEMAIATDRLQNELVADGIYDVIEDGNLVLGEKKLPVEVNGDVPKAGSKVAIQKGQVVKDGTNLNYGDYKVTIDDKGSVKATEKGNGVTLSDCTLVDGTANTIGAKYSCDFGAGARNFYVLEVGSAPVTGSTLKSNEVALILEGNYDMTTHPWCDQSNSYNPSCRVAELDAKLDEIAEAWTELERSQIGLPSEKQILEANGQYYECSIYTCGYLDSEWLYSYPNYAEWGEGKNPPKGYWTSTGTADGAYARFVRYNGEVFRDHKEFDHGVRPVVNLAI